jgi:8-oxo-dGTP pyrophosphatase MutT (NUDIX family)
VTPPKKAFAYAVHTEAAEARLLVFESHDEPGIEVPKGAVETGETFAEAAVREVREESGIEGARVLRELGTTWYEGEEQRFFLLAVPESLPDAFEHTVTGDGIDQGFVYAFRWVPIERLQLRRDLVQGCGAFVDALVDAVVEG